MKKQFLPLLCLCLLLSFQGISHPIYKPFPIQSKQFIPLLQNTPLYYVYRVGPNSEELTQKLVNSLSQIYSEKKISMAGLTAAYEDDQIVLSGAGTIYKETVGVKAIFTKDEKLVSFEGNLKGAGKINNRAFKNFSNGANLRDWFPNDLIRSVSLDQIFVAFDANSVRPNELSMQVSIAENWKILDLGNLYIKGITGQVIILNPTSSKSISSNLTGGFDVGGTTISTSASLGSRSADWKFTGGIQNLNFTDILKSIVGSANVSGISMPDNMFKVAINDGSFSIAPATKTFSLLGKTTIGNVELAVQPKSEKGKKLSFLAGFSPGSDFKMANIHSSLSVIDELKLTNFGMVLASDAQSNTSLQVFKDIGGTSSIGRGFNFISAYDLRPVGLDDLIGVESLMLRAVVSNRPSDLLLEASLNTKIPIGDIATFQKISFFLKPMPSNFEISLGGEMAVRIDGDNLLFAAKAGIDVTDQAIFFEGSMTGMWNDPFGAEGVSIGDLWMRFGVSFRTTPIPLPEMGIAGKLKVGTFEGDLLLFINTNNPTQSAIDAGFNQINLKDILETYCSRQVMNSIPAEIKRTVLDIELKDARLTIVPQPMTLNNVSYDAGFRVAGTGKIGDLGAKLDVSVDYNNGIDAYASVKAIKYPPFFELTGARGKADPEMHIVLKASSESKVAISGAATVLGLTSETDLLINDKGFDLYMNGKIFDLFNAKLEVSGSRVTDGGSFRVMAEMEQNLLEYITKHASEEIDKATKATQNDITKAQNDITREQKKIATLENDIQRMRKVVQGERDRDIAKLRAAEKDVANARAEVNKIQREIDGFYSTIRAAEKRIEAKKKWISDAPNFIEEGVRATGAAPFFTEQGLIITGAYTAIGGLETGRGVAQGVLYAAEGVVAGMAHLGDLTPIELDPRLATLYTAKDGSIAILDAAKGILEGGKIIGVGTLSAAKWIVENGPHTVVNVTYAKFEGKLSAVDGGSVTMQVKGTMADKPFNESFTFNFHNPIPDIVKFADDLL